MDHLPTQLRGNEPKFEMSQPMRNAWGAQGAGGGSDGVLPLPGLGGFDGSEGMGGGNWSAGGGGFGGGGAFGSGGGVGFGSGGGAFGGGLPGFWSAPDGDLSGRGGVSGGFDGTGWSSNDQDSQWESSTWESVPKKSNRR